MDLNFGYSNNYTHISAYLNLIIFCLFICVLVCLSILFLRSFSNNSATAYISVINFLKMFVLLNMFVVLFLFYGLFYSYINIHFDLINSDTFDTFFFTGDVFFFFFKNFFYELNIDFFGFIILFLSYTIGFLCIVCLNNRYYENTENLYLLFISFLVIVFLLVSTNNYVSWVIFYECLMLPSFLVVYLASSSRRAVQASIYFVI